jgi:hypothetical protein
MLQIANIFVLLKSYVEGITLEDQKMHLIDG